MGSQSDSLNSIADFIKPVKECLAKFNPDIGYSSDAIERELRILIRSGMVHDTSLGPDLRSMTPVQVGSDQFKLLVWRCALLFIEPAINPKYGKRKRLSKEQKLFYFELTSELHRLENGDALMSISPVE